MAIPCDECPATNDADEVRYDWILSAFGACVYNPAQCAAVFIGLLSIGFWIVAQVPQLYENFRNKSASALSPGFLMFWTLGDSFNLIGCILTQQLPTQTYTAIYFCFIDVILWSQFVYYTFCYRAAPDALDEERQAIINHAALPEMSADEQAAALVQAKHEKQMAEKKKRVSRRGSYLWGVLLLTLAVSAFNAARAPDSLALSRGARFAGPVRALLSQASSGSDDCFEDPAVEIIGEVIAWLCAALYLSSRLPQIYLNWKRGSVAGLSIHLFVFAVMGNLTYVLSILLSSTSAEDIIGSLPYLLGSGGTLIFDFTIFVQFKIYAAKSAGYEALPE